MKTRRELRTSDEKTISEAAEPISEPKAGLQEDGTVVSVYDEIIRTRTQPPDEWFMQEGMYKEEGKK